MNRCDVSDWTLYQSVAMKGKLRGKAKYFSLNKANILLFLNKELLLQMCSRKLDIILFC